MERDSERKLIITEDIAQAAVDLFLEVRPHTIALAGGNTPRPVYEALAKAPYAWSSLHVFFTDERCVPPDHPDSNFRMVNEALLSKVPAQVHAMAEDCNAISYEAELRKVFSFESIPQFDVIFLGLGAEGHTASLFPGDPALEERTRLVTEVIRPDHKRLTLTLPVLSAAKVAAFLVSGASKRGALKSLLAGDDSPAARVAAQRTIVIADRAAHAG